MHEDTVDVLSAGTVKGDTVKNPEGEDLGNLEEIMLDVEEGRVAYAVLSFGGILGLGDKLFAIPWGALKVDTEREIFVLDVDKEKLKKAPGFDKDEWPEKPNRKWMTEVYQYYGHQPYW